MAEKDKPAVRAALDRLLAQRRPALEELASAHAKWHTATDQRVRAEQAERDAETTYRDAREAAVRAGWGSAELTDAGFPAPSGRSRDARRRTNRRSNTATEHTHTSTHAPDTSEQS